MQIQTAQQSHIIYIYILFTWPSPVLKFLGADKNEPYSFVCVQVGRNRVFFQVGCFSDIWAPPDHTKPVFLIVFGVIKGRKVHQKWTLLIWLVPTRCPWVPQEGFGWWSRVIQFFWGNPSQVWYKRYRKVNVQESPLGYFAFNYLDLEKDLGCPCFPWT